jgi:GNAT superfamily N-acetyltransferase
MMHKARTAPALLQNLRLRTEVLPADAARVRQITETTGFFSPAEVVVAVELLEERLTLGPSCGYEFLFAESGDEVLAYTCFGPVPLTASSWDLYWIAVRRDLQGMGLGRVVLGASESRVRAAGGTRLYLDTSSRPQYSTTRAFYRACGYTEAAVLDDFYAPGDGKVIFCKVLP